MIFLFAYDLICVKVKVEQEIVRKGEWDMDPITIGIIGFAVMIILILARMPVAAALILVGVLGFGWTVGFKSALEILQTVPYATFGSQAMSRWVFWFMLLGLCLTSGLAYNLFAALSKWCGNNRTGSMVAALLTCGCFGSTAAFGSVGLKPLAKMLFPVLRKRGCSPEISTSLLAGGFSLGVLFPLPTTLLIIYGVITEQSIGQVLLCSLTPTVISILL